MALFKVQISSMPLAHGNIIFLSHVNSAVWAAKVVLCHKPLKMMFGEAMSQVSATIYVSLSKRQQAAGPRLCLETWRCSRQPELTRSRWLIAGSV